MFAYGVDKSLSLCYYHVRYRGVAQLAEQPSPKNVRPRSTFVLTVLVQYH